MDVGHPFLPISLTSDDLDATLISARCGLCVRCCSVLISMGVNHVKIKQCCHTHKKNCAGQVQPKLNDFFIINLYF
jgi:hypothetical protein